MKRYLTAHDIANDAKLMRALHFGTILIVEGDTDARVYSTFIDDTQCKIIVANGKDNAVKALEILEKSNLKGILAIVDTDFWKLNGMKPNSPNILLTDTHDLETMIISSSAFEKILSGFVNDRKIKKFGKSVREKILESALIIGLFRWLSSPEKDNLYLVFKGLTFENFIDKKTLVVNIGKLVNEVKDNSKNFAINDIKIKNKIIKLKNENHDPWHVCSGHDLIKILFIGLRNIVGNRRARNIDSVDALAEIIRISYDYSYFCLTELHKSIKVWEKSNFPFKLLKNSRNL